MTQVLTLIKGAVYPVTVDYTMSLAAMVAAGNYAVQNEDSITDDYIVSGNGVANLTIVLFRLNRIDTSETVLDAMAKQGHRPVMLPELLALGASYPDVQLEDGDIIELGSVDRHCQDEGYIILLGRTGRHQRRIWHDVYEGEWGIGTRFAAVKQ